MKNRTRPKEVPGIVLKVLESKGATTASSTKD